MSRYIPQDYRGDHDGDGIERRRLAAVDRAYYRAINRSHDDEDEENERARQREIDEDKA
jgi:hypothetical protein